MIPPSRKKNRKIYFRRKVHRQQQGQQSVIINHINKSNYKLLFIYLIYLLGTKSQFRRGPC
jgi:hypothetical protein